MRHYDRVLAELIRPDLERLALNCEKLILLWHVTEDNHLVLIDRAYSQTAIRVESACQTWQAQSAVRRGRVESPSGEFD